MTPNDSTNKVTQGPWVFSRDLDSTDSRVTFRVGTACEEKHKFMNGSNIGTQTAVCSNSDALMSADEAEANARLIAAAPELLEQLKQAQNWVAKVAADNPNRYLGTAASRRVERIQDTINKAEKGCTP